MSNLAQILGAVLAWKKSLYEAFWNSNHAVQSNHCMSNVQITKKDLLK